MKIAVFRNGVFRIRARDVITNRHHRALAKPYSIVDDILERASSDRPQMHSNCF